MKSKFSRIISAILILASLLSMLSVFAFAAESTDAAEGETGEGEVDPAFAEVLEKYPNFELLYQRNFEEGWEIKNGFTWTDRGSYIDVDYETTFDYNYNYFFRFTVGSKENSYLEMTFNNGKQVGSVFEFDMMSDDYCNIKGLMHFGTVGGASSQRENPQLLSIIDGKAYFFDDGHGSNNYGDADGDGTPDSARKAGQAAFDITEEWMHVAIVLDFTYGDVYNEETGELIKEDEINFLCSIYYAPKDEYEQTGELQLYDTRVLKGKSNAGEGIQLLRIGTSGEPEENFDTSVCFDNIVAYNGANEYGLATSEMGYGKNVDTSYSKTVEILGGGSSATEGDYLEQAIAMKVGVDYMRANSERTPIMTNEDGEVYGAPVEVDGVVYVPLLPVLDTLGYPYYVHKDGSFVDISTGESSSYISIGKDSATVAGERVVLNSAPANITDENGNVFIAIDVRDVDVLIPGWYHDYDALGLIIIGQKEDLIDRDRNLTAMTDVMKEFVFDYVSADRLYEDVQNYSGFDHPYLFGNQDKFDELVAALNAKEGDDGYDETLTAGVQRMVDNAEWYYSCYSKRDENDEYDEYVGLMTEQELMNRHGKGGYDSYCLEQPYLRDWFLEVDGEMTQIWSAAYGYDPAGGRCNFSSTRTSHMMYIALGWMLTKDVKYLLCAYDIGVAMGEWDHWGPGHFLNCADAAGPFALAYDWCYDGIAAINNGTGDLDGDGVADFDISAIADTENYNVETLENILYEKGVYEGYISSQGILTQYVSPIVGTGGSYYHDRVNNWNAVCSAGMIMASLAILDSSDSTIASNAAWLISDNIEHLARNGMGQYAPEGAYIESPGYWNYGTNNFFELCMSLESAAGQTYGLMDCWGIDTTCYFAMHTESSDFRTFNYHDGGMSQQDSSLFFYAAHYFNDSNISGARLAQLKNGKSFSLWDLFYYPSNSGDSFEVELDYYSGALDLYTARSSWDKGAIFIGMMGGDNKVTHGQLDAGSFVYHNMGTVWFIDLGTENYNCEGFWPEATRYRYYVMKPEGNNTMALASDPETLPYGQKLDSTAPTVSNGSNEYGSYVTFNMTETLGGLATYWHRGMLFTNDRKTTIIQDDVVLNGAQTMYWFGHYSSQYVSKVEISSDGRTAYMTYRKGGEEYMLRATLVSDKASLKFEIMDAYTFIHTEEGNPAESIPGNSQYTYPPEFAMTNGYKVPENDRSRYSKLVVKSVNSISFKMAVVLEEVDPLTVGTTQEAAVAYEWTDMNEWMPVEDSTPKAIGTGDENDRGPAKLSSLRQDMARAKGYHDAGTAYTSSFESYYRTMTSVYYVIRSFEGDPDLLSRYQEQIDLFEEYKAEYDAYIGAVSSGMTARDGVVGSILGF